MKHLVKISAISALLLFSFNSWADEEQVCEVRPTKNMEDYEQEIVKQGCKAGDLLLLRDMKLTARYVRFAAHVCDFEKAVVTTVNSTTICFYNGSVRKARNKNYKN